MTTGAAPGTAGTIARGLLRAARPRQWPKNLLVFVAPAAAGTLTGAQAWSGVALALVAFCLAASGTYLLNDAWDVTSDRRHPRKRHRPVADGTVPTSIAYLNGSLLLASAVAVAALGNRALLACVVGYICLTFAYTLWLKSIAICDITAVAGCHVLRAVAGAVAVGVPISRWFLLAVSLGALLIVAGKREAELTNHGAGEIRAALHQYTPAFLTQLRTMASAALIVTYCLWALEEHEHGTALGAEAASIVPFIMIVMRLNLLISQGRGEEPEELPLRDRALQLGLAALAGLLLWGVYGD